MPNANGSRSASPDNTIITLLGRKGSGKSTLARAILAEYRRVVILDTLGEYGDGAIIVEGGRESADALVRVSGEGNKRFRLSLRIAQRDDMLRVLTVASKLRDVLIVVEEASMLCKPSFLPDELAYLIRYGRHSGISQLYIARRPAELNREVTAQSDVVVTFTQHEPRDVEFLRAIMGERALEARRLAPYRVLAYGNPEKFPVAVIAAAGDSGTISNAPLDKPEEPT